MRFCFYLLTPLFYGCAIFVSQACCQGYVGFYRIVHLSIANREATMIVRKLRLQRGWSQ